ncbi:MAG TPA: ATP-binding protein [Polyangiaceae bacterium]|nr:ATP-binding protein [Polyangiaceae bacterium]
MAIARPEHTDRLRSLLRQFPVVGLIGPRQVGKTTLARTITSAWKGETTFFDLEDLGDRARLADPMLALRALRGLVVIDEIHHVPQLFGSLRVLADRPRRPARFLVLGSASPELLRQSAESLAGRIAYHELTPFSLLEVGAKNTERLWRRGGFPASYIARSEKDSATWRKAFVRTFLERDIHSFGLRLPPATLERFWAMVAHYHAQTWNGSELARAFGVSDATVRGYLDTLTATFVIRQLRPWSENVGKRQVRSPKVFIADTGLLHTLLGIADQTNLERHPKVGASWEGFALSQAVAALGAEPEECYFWATHQGAELDLLVVHGQRRLGFEFKRSSAPAMTRSMHIALADLHLESIDVIYPGEHTFLLAEKVRAVACADVVREIAPLARRPAHRGPKGARMSIRRAP